MDQRRLGPQAAERDGDDEGDGRDDQHGWHEDGADAVDQLLDRRLARLCRLNQAGNAAERGLGAGGGNPRDDAAIAVDGAGMHGLTGAALDRSEEHTSELQSLMRISYAVFCLKKKTK